MTKVVGPDFSGSVTRAFTSSLQATLWHVVRKEVNPATACSSAMG
ncbi:Uncharacterised protein [Mycobacteroides abscessus subsp. abscessus]|nr:Uncharacterised protein [Mycobacteroides abscessus subsp. abscessus]